MSRKITTLTGLFDSMDHYDENGKCIGHTTSPAEGVYYHYDEHWKKIGSSSEGLWGSYDNYDEHYNKVGTSTEGAPGIITHFDKHLSSLFSLVRRRYEKESFLFVSGRSGKHFIANHLLDSFFQTRAVLRAELQEDVVCSAADGENKRRLFCFLRFFDNHVIFHVRQWASFLHPWCIDLIAGIWRNE